MSNGTSDSVVLNNLLVSARAGDAASRNELLTRVREIAKRAVTGLCRNPHDRSDIAQVSCIRFYRRLSRINPGNIRAYVKTITVRGYCDLVRKRHVLSGHDLGFDVLDQQLVIDPPSRAVREREELELSRELIQAALPSLRPEQYRRVVGRWLKGIADGEAAKAEGIDEHKYRALLSRAKGKLLKEMNDLRNRRGRGESDPERE